MLSRTIFFCYASMGNLIPSREVISCYPVMVSSQHARNQSYRAQNISFHTWYIRFLCVCMSVCVSFSRALIVSAPPHCDPWAVVHIVTT